MPIAGGAYDVRYESAEINRQVSVSGPGRNLVGSKGLVGFGVLPPDAAESQNPSRTRHGFSRPAGQVHRHVPRPPGSREREGGGSGGMNLTQRHGTTIFNGWVQPIKEE